MLQISALEDDDLGWLEAQGNRRLRELHERGAAVQSVQLVLAPPVSANHRRSWGLLIAYSEAAGTDPADSLSPK